MNKLNKILTALKQIFPPYLLLIINYPLIIGSFINFDLIDSREIVLNFVWVIVFTIPYGFIKKKTYYRSVVLFYFIISLIETLHWLILKGPLTLTSLLVISATNYNESVSYLSLKLGLNLLLLIPLIAILIRGLKKTPIVQLNRTSKYIVGVTSIFFIVFISENAINKRFIRKGTPNFLKVSATFINKINLYNEVAKAQKPKKVDAKTNQQNQTFVLVIGESCNRNHMELYGASNGTNPKLKARKDLYVFKDIVSAYSNTISSVLASMSESNIDNKIPTEQSIDIIDIFNSAGFDTYWLSNQSPVGVWENLVTIFANKSNHKIFVNTASNSSFESTLKSSYDEKLFEPFKTVLSKINGNTFIVLHLMGSHTAYHKRYPKGFEEMFLKEGCKTWHCLTKKAAKKMSLIFKRTEKYNLRYPGNQIRGMALYEIFYLNTLKKNEKKINEFIENWPEKNENAKEVINMVRLNKSREKMRSALGMDLNTSVEDALEVYWIMSEFLDLGVTKKQRISKDLKSRKK